MSDAAIRGTSDAAKQRLNVGPGLMLSQAPRRRTRCRAESDEERNYATLSRSLSTPVTRPSWPLHYSTLPMMPTDKAAPPARSSGRVVF
ncbi:hypothetical protein CIB48_g1939 [Xylaria polymorpha]|nr:hypothetical protein CIB48_g1939 [Xylaria polymorpha]